MNEDMRDGVSNNCSTTTMCFYRLGYFLLLIVGGSSALVAVLAGPGIWFFCGLALVCACCPCICCYAMAKQDDIEELFGGIMVCLCLPCVAIFNRDGCGSD